jgi:hypothetical protein
MEAIGKNTYFVLYKKYSAWQEEYQGVCPLRFKTGCLNAGKRRGKMFKKFWRKYGGKEFKKGSGELS